MINHSKKVVFLENHIKFETRFFLLSGIEIGVMLQNYKVDREEHGGCVYVFVRLLEKSFFAFI